MTGKKKQVLIVKEKADYNQLPENGGVWLDQLSRGLLSQSAYYLKKNSNSESQNLLSILPENGYVDQLFIINQNRIPSREKMESILLKNADYYYGGHFSDSELETLKKFLRPLKAWDVSIEKK